MKNGNPNGANQHKVDPRQTLFLSNYLDTKSETFSNALQSALAAGYKEEYARNIMNLMPTWLSEKLDELQMMNKVNKNLKEFLDNQDDRLRFDATKFVGETLGKAKYSKRTEHTGKDGETLIQKDNSTLDSLAELIMSKNREIYETETVEEG